MRLIDADALLEQILDRSIHRPHFAPFRICTADSIDLKFLLNSEPTIDAVPVVRCKDCKYIRPEVDAYTQEVVGCWCSLLDLGSIQDEHFCSYGERKDGGA